MKSHFAATNSFLVSALHQPKRQTSFRWAASSIFIAPVINGHENTVGPDKITIGTQLGNTCTGYTEQNRGRMTDLCFPRECGSFAVKIDIKEREIIVQINVTPIQVYTVPGWRLCPQITSSSAPFWSHNFPKQGSLERNTLDVFKAEKCTLYRVRNKVYLL